MALACVYGAHDYLDFHTNWRYSLLPLHLNGSSANSRGLPTTRSVALDGASSSHGSSSPISTDMAVRTVLSLNCYPTGPIAKFMEHPLWQPLGRLSYTAYLVHRFITYYFFDLLDKPLHFASIWQQVQLLAFLSDDIFSSSATPSQSPSCPIPLPFSGVVSARYQS